MRSIEFLRRRDHYVHPRTDFFVEFPPGPLTVGDDVDIRPVEMRVGRAMVLALSATDSCRDRLAAFFHWNDRQSLDTAVAIAVRNPVNLRKIRDWAGNENTPERLDEFLQELKAAKQAKRAARRTKSGQGR